MNNHPSFNKVSLGGVENQTIFTDVTLIMGVPDMVSELSIDISVKLVDQTNYRYFANNK
jgi:hypothetical protein